MSKQDRGEHSRGSEYSEDEKPLKKARYVWEVKGKYHLKDTYKNNNTIGENNNIEPSSVKEGGTSQNAEENRSNCAKQDHQSCCCIKSFLAISESVMESNLDPELPTNNNALSSSIPDEVPVSLVSPKPKNQDYYLQKWQARQIARGFVDNTINSVLETWVNPPFDAVDFVENCDNDGQVEDDAILMAIQSHGLQSSSGNLQLINREPANMASVLNGGLEEFRQDNFDNYHKEQENQENTTSNNAESVSSCNTTDLELDDPMNFLNAAVSAAINKKGLSYTYQIGS